MISGIIFDKDGTLFDFQATWTAPFQRLLKDVAPGRLFEPAAEALGYDIAAERFRADSLVIASTTGEVAWALADVVDRAPIEIIETLDQASACGAASTVFDGIASGRSAGACDE